MKYLFFLTVPLCGAFRGFEYNSIRLPPRVSQTRNTPFGSLETVSLSDLYKEVDAKSIKGMYISNDLKDIYITDNSELTRVVHSNPLLTENIVETATGRDIKTVILEPTNTLIDKGTQFFGGLVDFVVLSVTLTIVYNLFVGLFVRGNNSTSKNFPMGMFSFSSKEKTVDKSTITTRLADWAGSPEVTV